jgi:hypothetical protein
VRFGTLADATAVDAVLFEGTNPAAHPAAARFNPAHARFGHVPGCACCGRRGPVATALAALFYARARGVVPWFNAVVAVTGTEAGAEAIRSALTDDVVTSARFRADKG